MSSPLNVVSASSSTHRPTEDNGRPVLATPEVLKRVTLGLPVAARHAISICTRIEAGELILQLPTGQRLRFVGAAEGPHAEIIVHDFAFARRLAGSGDIGFAEAYLRGEWETPDLPKFLEFFCANHAAIQRLLGDHSLVRLWQKFRHWLNRNTRSGSRRNIHAHYDLGNRFYEAWLDGTMTYSSALFADGDRDLAQGQIRKYKALAEQIGLKPEHHVLEIGCGWGGFAEYAAGTIGCRVTGLTISQEQFDYATQRMQRAGLSDRVTIKMQDYRDEVGVYDRIASIEMFEAVGEEYWPIFFDQLSRRLKDGGIAGLQVITIQDQLFETYRREIDFIRRYIFPGGMLPSPVILKTLGETVGLALRDERIFGQDYAVTLAAWRERFREAWPKLVPMGFDERFRRMWEYYLAYCEAGFRVGTIDVRQIVYAKGA